MNTTEIRIMTSGAFTAAYLTLIPRLEQLTGKKLVTAATSIGTGENSIPNRLRRRESVDVVIVADTVLRGFIKEGLIVADSYTPLARSAIGMAMRKGAPKPDIGTADALTSTLLQAQSIAYSASVSGEYLTTELLQRLGIADRVHQYLQDLVLLGSDLGQRGWVELANDLNLVSGQPVSIQTQSIQHQVGHLNVLLNSGHLGVALLHHNRVFDMLNALPQRLEFLQQRALFADQVLSEAFQVSRDFAAFGVLAQKGTQIIGMLAN